MKELKRRINKLFGYEIEDEETGKRKEDDKGIVQHILIAIESIQKWYNKQGSFLKGILIGIAILTAVIAPIASGYITMFTYAADGKYNFIKAMSLNLWQYFLIGLVDGLSNTIFIILAVAVFVFFLFVMKSEELDQEEMVDEETGVILSKTANYGSSHRMTKAEAYEKYTVGPFEKVDGLVCGQFGDDGSEVITVPWILGTNLNAVVIAPPGRGKTFSIVGTNVMQSCRRGESIVVVDPKGELCELYHNLFVEHGYKVVVYNVAYPKHSNAWNFTNEIFDSKTGRLDSSRLTTFVDVVMSNTTQGEKEDSFFGAGERNLFQAGVALLGWRYETNYERNIGLAADNWERRDLPLISDDDKDIMLEIIRSKDATIVDKENALKTLMRGSGACSEDEIEEAIRELRAASDPITIEKVFCLFAKNDFDGIKRQFKAAIDGGMPASHPAAIAWGIFEHGDPKTQPSFIGGLNQRLKLFTNGDICAMSAFDDIDLSDVSNQKTAIFCVISDKDTSRKLLTSLFFSFLFKDLSDTYDTAGTNVQNTLAVNVIFDEFANIGCIPNFVESIGTLRGRHIYLMIILQSIAQLARVYDENSMNIILGCCDTMICMGCNELVTAEYVSNMSGVMTIVSKSTGDVKSAVGLRHPAGDYKVSAGTGKRNAFTIDEVISLDKDSHEILIYNSGMPMLKAHSCGRNLHPYYKAGLPPKEPIAKLPTITDRYGEYVSAFEGVTEAEFRKARVMDTLQARVSSNQLHKEEQAEDSQEQEEPIDTERTSDKEENRSSSSKPKAKRQPSNGKRRGRRKNSSQEPSHSPHAESILGEFSE